MDRDRAYALVNDALSREYNSLVVYIVHSSPWATEADAPALAALEAIRVEEEKTSAWLSQRLHEDLRSGPTLKAFEHWHQDLNYLSVPYLLRFAVEHTRKLVARYEAALREAAGDAAVTAIFTRLVAEKRAQCAKIEGLLPKTAAPAKPAAPAAAAPKPAAPPPQRPT